MATGTTGAKYSNRECLFRLQTLVIDGGTEVLRNVFDQRLLGVALGVFLANEKKTIKILKQQNIITKAQYNLLYPPSGQPPTSTDFDITLIICLLRNLLSFGLNQNYTWNVPPKPTDASLEADLCRLKDFRNEVLLRLNTNAKNPILNFNQIMDSYKHIPLDAAAEHRNKTIIEQWQQMERSLETKVRLIKEDVNSLTEEVRETKKGVRSTEDILRYTKQGVMNIEHGISNTKQSIENIEQVVSNTKQGVNVIEKDIINTKQCVENIGNDVEDTREGVENILQDVRRLDQNVDDTKKDVHTMKQHLDVIKKDIEYIKRGGQTKEETKQFPEYQELI